ncbi:Aldo/keto reductase [Rostrohypoxylon terebratum]|nr:Aldo/keto reductase [Rostrohypoxylon terebratum]
MNLIIPTLGRESDIIVLPSNKSDRSNRTQSMMVSMCATKWKLRPFDFVTRFPPLPSIRASSIMRGKRSLSFNYHGRLIYSSNYQISGMRFLAMDSNSQVAETAPMPKIMYGTAWKGAETSNCVYQALKAGFRGIDTAAQPLHYKENFVGLAVRRAIREGIVKRNEIFIQTKFTPPWSQDLSQTLPYDPKAPIAKQIHDSITQSLRTFDCTNFEEPYIDSLVLHTPYPTIEDTITAWKTLEMYVPYQIKQLGISNASLRDVEMLCTLPEITVRPSCVQNRFYWQTLWEKDLRAYLREEGIVFQAFWILSANQELHGLQCVHTISSYAGVGKPAALYSLVLGLRGTAVLNGSRQEAHMKEDIEGIRKIEEWAQSEKGKPTWLDCLEEFKYYVGDEAL